MIDIHQSTPPNLTWLSCTEVRSSFTKKTTAPFWCNEMKLTFALTFVVCISVGKLPHYLTWSYSVMQSRCYSVMRSSIARNAKIKGKTIILEEYYHPGRFGECFHSKRWSRRFLPRVLQPVNPLSYKFNMRQKAIKTKWSVKRLVFYINYWNTTQSK